MVGTSQLLIATGLVTFTLWLITDSTNRSVHLGNEFLFNKGRELKAGISNRRREHRQERDHHRKMLIRIISIRFAIHAHRICLPSALKVSWHQRHLHTGESCY